MNSQSEKNQASKGGGEGDPTRGSLKRASEVDWAWVAMKKDQIGGQQDQNEGAESDPAEMKILRFHPTYVAGELGESKEE